MVAIVKANSIDIIDPYMCGVSNELYFMSF